MNTPQLRNCGLSMAAALIALASSATAATTVKLDYTVSPGQYLATPQSGWTTEQGPYDSKAMVGGAFWTFCLETNQYFNGGGVYDVAFSATNSTDGGSGNLLGGVTDKISLGTAYLYELFAKGTLFAGTSYSTDQGAELQLAIWSLEDEVWNGAGVSTYLKGVLDAMDGAHDLSFYKADYSGTTVGVMNLTTTNPLTHVVTNHQDQLIYRGGPPVRGGNVPDGGTSLLLLGISLGGLGIARRFSRA